ETQIEGFKNAMTRDGVALVKGIMEIERRVLNGDTVTELTVAEILTRHRSERELYFDDSFTTIAGYGPHGAIVHYSATPETDTKVGTDNLLLIDSGAQYLDGTTDITRTIIIGNPSEKQREDFTTVLRGNINLALAVFPSGTRGTQLDVLAHLPLWERGLNYLHGTGHGIGHFLNVHEGPHSIRMNDVPTPLEPGMLVTDEPGVYIEGEYGIRCENVILCKHQRTTAMRDFLQFEAITLFPFDRKLVKPSMMTDRELTWLNEYHKRVYETLAPHLNTEEREWLANATSPINKD
ncbi:MAG: M24 family metallopeptidase, partial [Bacteroidales bacterium]|nr:M24 family metallopeptidase [Bacteroidales bacterium]